jgi:cytochrome bd-type quinol oxidase subunit 2
LRHVLIYFVGILTLLYAFVPYDNQLAVARFITVYSAGLSSSGTMSMLLFGYLPMAVVVLLAISLTWRQLRRRDAGLLDARGKLILEAEMTGPIIGCAWTQ